MGKRRRGRPRYSQPGGRRYVYVITKSLGHSTGDKNVVSCPIAQARAVQA